MMYGWNGWGMSLIGPLVLALIVWLVWSVVNDTAESASSTSDSTGPRRTLDDRFARGEIDRDEYQQRLATLERR